MTMAPQALSLDEPLGPLPREFAAIMRPELPSLLEEIGAELRRAVPECAELLDGPYGRTIRLCVEVNITTFVERVADPSASVERRDAICQRLGRGAARVGRSIDELMTAYQLGARLALRHAKRVGKRYNLSPAVMLMFADTLFAYVDELGAATRSGFLAAQAEAELGEQLENDRRRLLRLIMAGPSAPRAKVAELAERTRWPLPDEVTVVALSPDPQLSREDLEADALVDLTDPQPYMLVPGAFDVARRALLEAAIGDSRAVVGITMPLDDATDALRWARQALALADSGVIPDAPVINCEDHLVTLWLLTDPALTEQLARRLLQPLTKLTETQRERLIETLRAWLTTRGNAVEMADQLHLHPQTVRYRMRNLERVFGSRRLSDPEQRFATETVLRALRLRENATVLPLPRHLRQQ
jgi:DNA-binding CsgD family transcriptional regulator